MTSKPPIRLHTADTALAVVACANPTPTDRDNAAVTASSNISYVGTWVTSDGYIHQQLLADGRYDEARGQRASAYTGSYTITGTHIDYIDDTGFTADGTFVDADTLHHGGYTFHREKR
ncbi:Atu4866 domain-containing protein [Nocardia ignorata]|nr:Atu4866 domain-containing protein [Nocardia ignorata]